MKLFKDMRYYIKQFVDFLFSEILLVIRKDNYVMTNEKLELIKEVSKLAYPNEESVYENIRSIDDLATEGIYCRKGKLYVLTGKDWYFILIREFSHIFAYDFASSSGRCTDILKIYSDLISLFKGKKGVMCCVENTSYPLVLLIEKRGYLRIISDSIVEQNGERLHKLYVTIKR